MNFEIVSFKNNWNINYSWYNFLEEKNKKTFDKINDICLKNNVNTLDFIFKLRENEELREYFLEKNQNITIDEIIYLVRDIFFPLENVTEVNIDEVKSHTEKILKVKKQSEQEKLVEKILWNSKKNTKHSIMAKINFFSKIYLISVEQFFEWLKNTNLSEEEFVVLRTKLNKVSMKNSVKTSLKDYLPKLHIELSRISLDNLEI